MSKTIDIAIGMSDGLIVPLALTSCMYAAGMSGDAIVQAGIAIVGAGTVIMTMGGFFAGRSGLENPTSEADKDPVAEEEKATRAFLARLDVGTDIQDKAIAEWKEEQTEWAALMQEEIENKKQNKPVKKPIHYALNIGLSYLLGGLIPLSAYFFLQPPYVFPAAVTITLFAATLLGIIKSKALLLPWYQETIRLLLLALLATVGAYAVGYYFF